MKKISFLLALLLSLSLCACGTPRAPEVTDNEWQLGSVISEENGYSEFLYVSDEYVSFFKEGQDVPRIECTMTAKNGEITIEDKTNGKTYTGTYSDEEEFSPDATVCRVVINSKKGHALTQRLSDADGNDLYAMSLSVGDYELFFMKK
jgi:hypothetical protein